MSRSKPTTCHAGDRNHAQAMLPYSPHHQPGNAERIERGSRRSPTALFLSHLRERLGSRRAPRVMHERLTNLRPVIFVQLDDGTRVARSGGRCTAPPRCSPIAERSSSRSAKISTPPAWTRPVVTRYRTNPIEMCISCRIAEACKARSTDQNVRFRHARRRHAQISHGAAGAADTRIHGACARAVESSISIRSTCSRPGTVMGWAMDRPLGNFCTPCRPGDWELTGRETLAAQRSGLTPESPRDSMSSSPNSVSAVARIEPTQGNPGPTPAQIPHVSALHAGFESLFYSTPPRAPVSGACSRRALPTPTPSSTITR